MIHTAILWYNRLSDGIQKLDYVCNALQQRASHSEAQPGNRHIGWGVMSLADLTTAGNKDIERISAKSASDTENVKRLHIRSHLAQGGFFSLLL